MPHYHFFFSNRDLLVRDIEGTDLPDLAAARCEAATRCEAVQNVEHLRQPGIRRRRSWAGWMVQVRDKGGAVLFEVPFT